MLEVLYTGWCKSWYVLIPGVHVHKQNIIHTDDKVTGIFRLSLEDEEEYFRTNSFYHVKKMQPCLSPGSTFLKLIEEGKIPEIDAEYCYFEVKQYRDVYAPIPRMNIQVEVHNVFTVIDSDKQAGTLLENKVDAQPNKSDWLRALNSASEHYWSFNADRDDKTTWPVTKEIEGFLIRKGFSPSLAKAGATIIRPKWAPPGRNSN